MIFNLLVVWLATGLWHGAHLNFLLWGLGLFAVLVVEKLWLKKYLDRWPILGHLYMLVLIPVSWAVFSVSDFGQLGAYFGRLFPLFSRTAAAYPLDFLKYGKTYGVFLILGLLCSTSLPGVSVPAVQEHVGRRGHSGRAVLAVPVLPEQGHERPLYVLPILRSVDT